MASSKPVFAWHVHHEILVEPLTEPIEKRIEYIRTTKPKHEIELRLWLLNPVIGQLPQKFVKAGRAYYEAMRAYHEAERAYYEAMRAYHKAGGAYSAPHGAFPPSYHEAMRAYHETGRTYHETGRTYHEAMRAYKIEIDALHKMECPNCPWDGTTIFPKERPL